MDKLRERLIELALAGSIKGLMTEYQSMFLIQVNDSTVLDINYTRRGKLETRLVTANGFHAVNLKSVDVKDKELVFKFKRGLVITYQMEG